MKRYETKKDESFKTKLNYYIFNQVMNGFESGSWESFNTFMITQAIIDAYNGQYWQYNPEDAVEYDGLEVSVKDIERRDGDWRKNNEPLIEILYQRYGDQFESILFPREKFKALIDHTSCHYCNHTIADFENLAEHARIYKKNYRGWTLEIERLNPHIEYTPENTVLACYWCNNAKTDEFTADEFKKIGDAIQEIWEARKKREVVFNPQAE